MAPSAILAAVIASAAMAAALIALAANVAASIAPSAILAAVIASAAMLAAVMTFAAKPLTVVTFVAVVTVPAVRFVVDASVAFVGNVTVPPLTTGFVLIVSTSTFCVVLIVVPDKSTAVVGDFTSAQFGDTEPSAATSASRPAVAGARGTFVTASAWKYSTFAGGKTLMWSPAAAVNDTPAVSVTVFVAPV
jgi:hypothetical protein